MTTQEVPVTAWMEELAEAVVPRMKGLRVLVVLICGCRVLVFLLVVWFGFSSSSV